jgi:hypothetical protein
METGRDQARHMCDVGEEERSDFVGNASQAGEVDLARIGRGAGEQDMRLQLAREVASPVEINLAGASHAEGDDLAIRARDVTHGTMADMTAGQFVESEQPRAFGWQDCA